MRVLAVFGHPGHELLTLRLLADCDSEICCLTDGSGGAMADRTPYSRAAIAAMGARVGPVMGACADRELYADFLAGEPKRLAEIAGAIADRAAALRPDIVLTDSFEYFNPVHDIANVVADVAIVRLRREGVPARKLVYPNEYPGRLDAADAAIARRLDEREKAEKLAAIEAYAPLAHEFRRFVAEGRTAIGETELYYDDPVRLADIPPASSTVYETVFYEEYGRRMVAEGRYDRLITLADHFVPMARRLAASLA